MTDFDALFSALADPTRRAIVARLTEGPAGVEELRSRAGMSQPAISKHLAVLEKAGLVAVEIDGPRRPRRLVPGPLVEATAWIDRTRAAWETNFARLDTLLLEIEGDAEGDPE